ncbi:SulP family inorganic anion transporter [Gordonia sp. TBRC 11910]|uniref:SulP family inorganic anion transporter n=1 Tax=Gordonia asplenii TaxID=2725283 RepID=A0A848KZC5_9ACTN|nr:SulP family inorganic anion transporter [Gordonia asplenii]NMO04064.1 SulP family inorganic anion transporter [Gordonia asplenii]
MATSGWVSTVIPPALRGYQRNWLRADIVAGVTLAAVAIPECMGYSSIAQVPVSAGLYTIIIPAVIFALLGASRLLVVGADSATAALMASGVTGLAIAGLSSGTQRWLDWCALIAIVTGVLLLIAWVLRLGFLGDFLSTSVLTGFLTGVGVSVFIGQLAAILGLPGEHGNAAEKIVSVVRHLGDVNFLAVAFAAITLGAILAGDRFARHVPFAVLIVVGSIVVVRLAHWSDRLPVVGSVSGGLPKFGWPGGLAWHDVVTVLPIAAGCALVVIAQSAATARSFAQRHGQEPDVNRDLLGLAGANVAAGLTGTFVVNGSPTKTELLDEQHGRSQVANITMAVVALAVVLFLTDQLTYLPHAVLGAIVSLIAVRLIHFHDLRRIWEVRRIEFAIALVTAAVVVFMSVRDGIIIAMVLSLIEIIRRQYSPNRFVIGVRENGAPTFISAQPGTQSAPGLIVFRYDAELFYANASRFADDVMSLIEAAPDPVRWLILDCSAIADVDYSASKVLNDLIDYVHSHHAHFVLAGVDPELRDALLTNGVLGDVDPDHVYADIPAAVAGFRAWESAGGQDSPVVDEPRHPKQHKRKHRGKRHDDDASTTGASA